MSESQPGPERPILDGRSQFIDSGRQSEPRQGEQAALGSDVAELDVGAVALAQDLKSTLVPYVRLCVYELLYLVPEPATMGLLALGGLAVLRRRRPHVA